MGKLTFNFRVRVSVREGDPGAPSDPVRFLGVSPGSHADRRGELPRAARVPPAVEGSDEQEGFRQRMTRQGEEAIGKLAQDLLENPMVSGALARALETREHAMRAQEAALGALNLP